MKNRINVTIAGQELSLLVEDNEEYIQKVAYIADQKISSITHNSRISSSQALVLACLNVVDDLLKAQELTEHLRAQLKEYIEEASKNKMEITDLKREVTRLKAKDNEAPSRSAAKLECP